MRAGEGMLGPTNVRGSENVLKGNGNQNTRSVRIRKEHQVLPARKVNTCRGSGELGVFGISGIMD